MNIDPSIVIVRLYNNVAGLDVEHPIADLPSGRYTQTWPAGWDGACFIPVDSLGMTNTLSAAYRCTTIPVAAIDTTPPVLSGCTPVGNLWLLAILIVSLGALGAWCWWMMRRIWGEKS